MKKLTQDIFKGAPEWVKSASVEPFMGGAIYHDVPVSGLTPWLDVPFPMMRGGHQDADVGEGYDATGWQDSAIDREVVDEH